jgi:hypothetical protein
MNFYLMTALELTSDVLLKEFCDFDTPMLDAFL